ncbi:pesticin immunity protein [Xanthomonas sp. NCPPB 1128]|uniref:pesticin immunity protein n=1 Tax=Xanthomonas sp. NCPPB 1128 TaxID=1775876 RepID=UPI00065AC38E|nr:pesticin immunity protein [Xanthomonas sp. NCPPB 1128]KMM77343.1 pesticin immunity protein [Xanthomonas sp. NCPPB 1128]
MNAGMLVGLVALGMSASSLAASHEAGVTDAIIQHLDLTSFPNSVGPRRMPGKTTFADYGFVDVTKTADGARLLQADKGWMMRFEVLSADPTSVRLCFHDSGLARPGDTSAPSYNATSALLVAKSSRGNWTARQVPAGFADCRNDPVDA